MNKRNNLDKLSFYIGLVVIVVAVLAILLIINANKYSSNQSTLISDSSISNTSSATQSNMQAESVVNDNGITNPDYLSSPEKDKILVDSGEFPKFINIFVGGFPKAEGKAVWVEKVTSMNTIKVSTIIQKQDKKILIFKTIGLIGLLDISSGENDFSTNRNSSELYIDSLRRYCNNGLTSFSTYPMGQGSKKMEEVAISFLKNFIEHKYVFINQTNNFVYIENKNIDPSIKIYDPQGTNGIMISRILVKNGFGIYNPGSLDQYPDLKAQFIEDQKLMELSKEGIWNFCMKK